MPDHSEMQKLELELHRLEKTVHELEAKLYEREVQHPANSADVTNPYVLQLGCSIWWNMMGDKKCIDGMNKIQMDYAIEVAAAAGKAYGEIKAMIEDNDLK